MEFPQKYRYYPSWRRLFAAVIFFGGGSFYFHYMAGHPREGLSLVLLTGGDSGTATFYNLLAAVGAAMVALAVAAAVRRCFFRDFIELRGDAIVVPRGFFRPRNVTHPYTSIRYLEEKIYSHVEILHVQAEAGKFTISSRMLPDHKTYVAVRDFLAMKCAANAAPPPEI